MNQHVKFLNSSLIALQISYHLCRHVVRDIPGIHSTIIFFIVFFRRGCCPCIMQCYCIFQKGLLPLHYTVYYVFFRRGCHPYIHSTIISVVFFRRVVTPAVCSAIVFFRRGCRPCIMQCYCIIQKLLSPLHSQCYYFYCIFQEGLLLLCYNCTSLLFNCELYIIWHHGSRSSLFWEINQSSFKVILIFSNVLLKIDRAHKLPI